MADGPRWVWERSTGGRRRCAQVVVSVGPNRLAGVGSNWLLGLRKCRFGPKIDRNDGRAAPEGREGGVSGPRVVSRTRVGPLGRVGTELADFEVDFFWGKF